MSHWITVVPWSPMATIRMATYMSFVIVLIIRCCLWCNSLPSSLLLKSQSVSWHVRIFRYFQFKTTLQRKEELSVRGENGKKWRGKTGEASITLSLPTHINIAPLNSQKKRGNIRTRIASTTQAHSYANFAVSVSTFAVLTEGVVARKPSLLPHHLFKSFKQKPGGKATWLVKYACVGPLQWNNDCGITPACARGCVAISCQHWVNVRDVYSWGK